MIRKLFQRIKARIPEELPTDQKSMERFISETLSTYNIPNTPDYQRALVLAIHGITQATHKAPKFYFYSHLRRFEAMRAAVAKVSELEKAKQAATPKKESHGEADKGPGSGVG